MRFLLLILSLCFLGLTSCTKKDDPSPNPVIDVGCSMEQALASGIATGLATNLGCSADDAIRADLLKAIGKANLCVAAESAEKALKTGKAAAEKPKAVIGNIVCPMLVQAIGMGAMTQVPASWKCTGGTSLSSLQSTLTTLCMANVPF